MQLRCTFHFLLRFVVESVHAPGHYCGSKLQLLCLCASRGDISVSSRFLSIGASDLRCNCVGPAVFMLICRFGAVTIAPIAAQFLLSVKYMRFHECVVACGGGGGGG